MRWIKPAIGILLVLLVAVLVVEASAQDLGMSPDGSNAESDTITPSVPGNKPSRRLERMRDSFKQTKKDTDQLYDMATELKKEMDDANEDVLSLDVVKKADQIEKLAGKIKSRMKNL